MIKILIVDDHAVVRSELQSLLDGKHDMCVVGVAADGEEALRIAESLRPQVVLMDLSMPHGKDGLTTTAEFKQKFSDIAILILTMHDYEEYLFRAIQAGASGYVLKSSPHDELLTAIQLVASGKAYLSPRATIKLMKEYLQHRQTEQLEIKLDSLTEREQEIVEFVVKGFSNKQIAEKLIISVKTVETHKSHIMGKLNLQTRADLVEYAVKKGLLYYE